MTTKKTTQPDEQQSLSELELSLTILWNSVKRWMSQRSKEGVLNGLSDLDVFLMHLLVYRDRQLRANDLAFALSIDDMHLVSYSLKKLVRVEGSKFVSPCLTPGEYATFVVSDMLGFARNESAIRANTGGKASTCACPRPSNGSKAKTA